MRTYSYISVLLILSFNQLRVLSRHLNHNNAWETEQKFKLPRDNEDPHNRHFWHHRTDGYREQDHRDNDRIIFPDYEDSSDGYTTYKPLNMKTCISSCKINPNSDHVCGTDGVNLRHLSSCSQRTGHNSLIETSNINACMSSCPTTSEYNPVCGTNNKTYTNPGKLHCAQACGVDVQLKYRFTCPKTPTTTANPLMSTRSPLTTTNNDILVCINSCPTTSEYNPVCGSDGKTYYNIGKLECAKYCGINVIMFRTSPC